ncbi:VWA domain-containing protein [Draconibacterium sp.]|nr:VWA domain-containing protein [Draconibacterium sp.]
MSKFINEFFAYFREAPFNSIVFWAFPIFTLLFIWLITILGLKIFTKREKLKTVFIVNRAWIISSLIAGAIIIGLICYWWTQNYFSAHPLQLSLLFALTISLSIPLISLINLRKYYTQARIKEITDQPKTTNQLNAVIILTKDAFNKNKVFFLIPLLGFLLLAFYLLKGNNLIAFVFDNSGSMTQTTAVEALSETFDNLEENNKIVLTTLNGPNYVQKSNAKRSISELMSISNSSRLYAGNIKSFQNPIEAKGEVLQITGFECCSPICESIWKTYLYINENMANETFRKKLLVVISDGEDNYISESLTNGRFFFDDESFAEFFPAENIFVIDYSNGNSNPFLRRVANEGCDVYPAENNKQGYLDALDNALQSFKNNWFLIYWTIVIFSIFTIVGLLIQPKKIV